MPVVTKRKLQSHVNPTLKGGEVYKIIRGYGTGRVFVMTGGPAPYIQYLSGSGNSGWDKTTSLESSDFVEIILQEV